MPDNVIRNIIMPKIPESFETSGDKYRYFVELERILSEQFDGNQEVTGDLTIGGEANLDVVNGNTNNVTTVNSTTVNATTFNGGNFIGNSVDVDTVDTEQVNFDTTNTATPDTGELNWNATDGTLQLGMPGSSVVLQIGQETLIRVKNTSGSTITNGSAVYISGASGSVPLISLADADTHSQADNTVAVATEDISNNDFGYVTAFGIVRGIDTTAASAGDTVYLSQTAGSFTTTRPTAPASTVYVGIILYSHANAGALFVRIHSNPNIEELSNVDVTDVDDLHILAYNSSTGRWENGETQWEDLRVPAQNTKLNPSQSEPNFEELYPAVPTGLFIYKYGTGNGDTDSVHFVAQMSHGYKEGTDLEPHLHWCPDTTDTGDVRWEFEYIIANVNGTFSTTPVSNTLTTAADGTAFKHQLAEFPVIDGTGLTVSHMIICRLTRLGASDAADTFTGNACFLEFDFHFQKNTLGSRNEFTKA